MENYIQDNFANEMRLTSAIKHRRIFLSNEVDRESIFEVLYFLDRLYILDKKSNTKEPIEIIINSYGGIIYHGLSLISKIEQLKNEGYTIITTVSGIAMSMGFMIALVGSIRQSYKYATFLCHQPSSSTWGTLQELEDGVDETKRLWNLMKKIIMENTNVSEKVLDDMKIMKQDWILSPKEALELKIIDKIL